MRFEEILPAVKAGGRATRPGWRGTWLERVQPPPLPDGRMIAPVYVIACEDETREMPTWGRSDSDLSADDWLLT